MCKTIFARLQEVKIGSLVDSESGEDISNVDKLLKSYGINLKEVTNNMTDMGALLDMLGGRWDSYTTMQKSELATTIAGIRQRDKFLVLMNEYDRALELETVSLESAGSAMDKYGIYIESTEAKINKMKTAFTELADTTLKSDFVEGLIGFATKLIEVIDLAGGLAPVLLIVVGVLIAVKTGFLTAAGAATAFHAALGVIGLAMAAISLAVGIFTAAINSQKKALENKVSVVEKDIAKTNEQLDATQKLKEEYISLMAVENKTEVESEKLAKIKEKLIKIYGKEANALDLVNGKYDEQTKLLRAQQIKDLEKQKKDLEYASALTEKQLVDAQQLNLWDKAAIGDWQKSVFGNITDPIKRYEILQREQKKLLDREKSGEKLNLPDSNLFKVLTKELESQQPFYEKLKENREEQAKIQQQLSSIKEIGAVSDHFAIESAKFLNMSLEEQARNLGNIDIEMEKLTKSPFYEKYKTEIDAIIAKTKEQVEIVKKTDFALIGMESQIKALEKEKQLREDELKQQEKLLAIEKAREALAKAKDKRIMAFRLGKGMVEIQDVSEIESAQKNLDKAIQDSEGTNTDKAIAGRKDMQELYNRVISEGTQGEDKKIDNKTLREWFLDMDFKNKFEKEYTHEQQKAFLQQFLKNSDWDLTKKDLVETGFEDTDRLTPQYANGTTSAQGGISLVGERGTEMRVLNKGDGILNSNITKNLMSIGANPNQYFKQELSKNNSGQTISIGNLNLPNVNDTYGFIEAMKKLASPKQLKTT